MKKYTQQELIEFARKFGTVTFEGKEYTLIEMAEAENYCHDDEVRYYARAISTADDAQVEYLVEWERLPDYELACELDYLQYLKRNKCSWAYLDEEQEKRLQELQAMPHIVKIEISDESNACDWSNPSDVTVNHE